MESAEWYETVFVIGKRMNSGTFDNENCKVFDKNGRNWIVNHRFYDRLELPVDPCKWDQVCYKIIFYCLGKSKNVSWH